MTLDKEERPDDEHAQSNVCSDNKVSEVEIDCSETSSLKNNTEVESFKSIARELKRLSQARKQQRQHDEEDDFQSRQPTKVASLSEEVNKKVDGSGENEEKTAKSLITNELRQDIIKILKQFFKAAFTIIVKRRRLCPSNAFFTVKVLGIKVPRFLHPSSLEYVEEVSQKLVLLLSRNTTEGCVMHVMIEKNKTLHVVQRFIFQALGSLDIMGNLQKQSQDDKCDITDLKTYCRTSLLQLLNSDAIKPMLLPQFSRWSISIGLKPEFVNDDINEIKQLWSTDPSSSYFPWKERPKSLASRSTTSASTLGITSDSKNNPLPNENVDINPSATESKPQKTDDECFNTDNCTSEASVTAPPDSISEKNNGQDRIGNGIVCFPISNFTICDGVVMSIYGLQYPAPIKAILENQVSTNSPHSSTNTVIKDNSTNASNNINITPSSGGNISNSTLISSNGSGQNQGPTGFLRSHRSLSSVSFRLSQLRQRK